MTKSSTLGAAAAAAAVATATDSIGDDGTQHQDPVDYARPAPVGIRRLEGIEVYVVVVVAAARLSRRVSRLWLKHPPMYVYEERLDG